jgi:pimeloyl-ACP methyl ester carboxylesterase
LGCDRAVSALPTLVLVHGGTMTSTMWDQVGGSNHDVATAAPELLAKILDDLAQA